jgi:hypothetical protein
VARRRTGWCLRRNAPTIGVAALLERAWRDSRHRSPPATPDPRRIATEVSGSRP